jgi:uncharacterized integral membrane protein
MEPAKKPRRIGGDAIAAIILIVLGVIFVFENTSHVDIRFIGPKVRVQVWIALLASLAAGVIVGWLLRRSRERGG